MPLHKWLEGQLREFLGYYVEIDAEALKLGVWKGDLVLENVRLLPGPIPGTQLCIVEGRLRRLELRVPWKHLRRKPVVMRVGGLDIVYGPQRAMTAADREKEARLALGRKRELVRMLDEGRDDSVAPDVEIGDTPVREPSDFASANGPGEQTHKSFRERLVDTVLTNVEINVDGFTATYRDSTAEPFAFVAKIRSLTVQSCNSEWEPEFVERSREKQTMRKRVTLADFSISFQCCNHSTAEDILRPVTGSASLTFNNVGIESGRAANICRLNLDSVELTLSRAALVSCAVVGKTLWESSIDAALWHGVHKYRPAERPTCASGTAKLWWQYALCGVQHMTMQRTSRSAMELWASVAWHIHARSKYIRIYAASKRRPVAGLRDQPSPPTEAELEELQVLEDRLAIGAIVLYRRLALAELQVERSATKAAIQGYKRTKQAELGSRAKRMQMKVTLSKAAYQALKPEKPVEMLPATLDQRRELYLQILVESQTVIAQARDVRADIQVHVTCASITLVDHRDVANLHSMQFRIDTFELRLQFKLRSWRLESRIVSIGLVDTRLLNSSNWGEGHLLRLRADAPSEFAVVIAADTDGPHMHSCSVTVAPVSFVYSDAAHTFAAELVSAISARAVPHFVTTATSRIARFTSRAKMQLKSRLHKKQTRAFSISVSSITIICPVDIFDINSSALTMTISNLRCSSGVDHADQTTLLPVHNCPVPDINVLDDEFVGRLYQRVKLVSEAISLELQGSHQGQRCYTTHQIVPAFSATAELQVMMVDEIQVKGTSLTANLPWYILRLMVPNIAANLLAEDIASLLSIGSTVLAVQQAVSTGHSLGTGTADVTDAEVVCPLRIRAELYFGHVEFSLHAANDFRIGLMVTGLRVDQSIGRLCDQNWTRICINSAAVLEYGGTAVRCPRARLVWSVCEPNCCVGWIKASKTMNADCGSDVFSTTVEMKLLSTLNFQLPDVASMQLLLPLREHIDALSERATHTPRPRNLSINAFCPKVVASAVFNQTIDCATVTIDAWHLGLTCDTDNVVQTEFGASRACIKTNVLEPWLGTTAGSSEVLVLDAGNRQQLQCVVRLAYDVERRSYIARYVEMQVCDVHIGLSNTFCKEIKLLCTAWSAAFGPVHSNNVHKISESCELKLGVSNLKCVALCGVSASSYVALKFANIVLNKFLPNHDASLIDQSTTAAIAAQRVRLHRLNSRLGLKPGVGKADYNKNNSEFVITASFSLRFLHCAPNLMHPLLRHSCTVSVRVSMLHCCKPPPDTVLIEIELPEFTFVTNSRQRRDLLGAIQIIQKNVFVAVLQKRATEKRVSVKFLSGTIVNTDDLGQELMGLSACDVHLETSQPTFKLNVASITMQASSGDGESFELLRVASFAGTYNNDAIPSHVNAELASLLLTMAPGCIPSIFTTSEPDYAKGSSASTLSADQFNPRIDDFVLSDDDIITQDLLLTSDHRLFITSKRPGARIMLQGNGFSLKLASVEQSEYLVFVAPGITLLLEDLDLENWNNCDHCLLGAGARISHNGIELASVNPSREGRPFRELMARSLRPGRDCAWPSQESNQIPELSFSVSASSVRIMLHTSNAMSHQKVLGHGHRRSHSEGTVYQYRQKHQNVDRKQNESCHEFDGIELSLDRVHLCLKPKSIAGKMSFSLNFNNCVPVCHTGDNVRVCTTICDPLSGALHVTTTKALAQFDVNFNDVFVQLQPIDFRKTLDVLQRLAAVWVRPQLPGDTHSAFARGLNIAGVLQFPLLQFEFVDQRIRSFARLAFSNIKCAIVAVDDSAELNLRLLIGADSYYDPLSAWEPAVDKCELLLDAVQSCDESSSNISLRSTDALTINVTQNMLTAVDSMWIPWLRTFHKDPSHSCLTELRKEAPSYVIKNDTLWEVAVEVFSSGTRARRVSLRPQEDATLDCTMRNNGSNESLQIQVGACVNSILCPINRVGVSRVVLMSTNDEQRLHTAIHIVQANASVKHVSIRSDMYISNCTSEPMAILIEHHGTSTNEFVSVSPFSGVSCSIHNSFLIVPGEVRTSSKHDSSFDVVSGHEWAKIHIDGKVGTQQVCCEPKPDSAETPALSFLWNCTQGCENCTVDQVNSQSACAVYRVQMCRDTSGRLGMDIGNKVAFVTAVRGPAAKAGIKVGWRIVECNRQSTKSKDQVVAQLAGAGNTIELGFDTQGWLSQESNFTDHLIGGISFEIKAPLIVQNRLPCEISVNFTTARGRSSPKFFISPGADLSAFELHSVQMKIGVEGHFDLDFKESSTVFVDEQRSIEIYDSNGSELRLEIDSRLTGNGQRTVAIYVNSWILNYTGLPLRYASGQGDRIAGQCVDGSVDQGPCICHHDTMRIQIVGEANMFASHLQDTEWSRSFNITSVGTTGMVSIVDRPNRLSTADTVERHRYDLVVAIRAGRGRYRRTRMVALSPRLQLLNRLQEPLFFRHSGQAETPGVAVSPNGASATPVYFTADNWNDGGQNESEMQLCFRIGFGTSIRWSAASCPEAAWNLALFVPSADGGEILVRLDCQEPGASGSQILMVREFEPQYTGYLVQNYTGFSMSMWQISDQGRGQRILRVEPASSHVWVWDQPLMPHDVTAELELHDSDQTTLQISCCFDLSEPFDPIIWEAAMVMLVVTVHVRGDTNILRIASRPLSGDQPRVPRSSFARQLNRQATQIELELNVSECVISLVNRSPGPVDLLAVVFQGCQLLAYVEVEHAVELHASVAVCQIEDADTRSQSPVLFSAVDPNLEAPFLQLRVTKSLLGSADLFTFGGMYPYIGCTMQSASIAVTDSTLQGVMDFFGKGAEPTSYANRLNDSPRSNSRGERWNADGSTAAFSTSVDDLQDIKPIYVNVLELKPIHIVVTYTTTGIASASSVPLRIPYDVEDASLRLDALVLFHTHTTPRLLAREISKRYQRQLAYEVFKLVGTADLLGNPVGLLDSLATGVAALFYEPASAIFRGPTDVPAGIAKGVGQLLHNSIHGPMMSLSKVTGAVSKAMASLSYDDAYIKERSTSNTRAAMRSGHLGHGLWAGAEGITKGVASGVGGLFVSPARGIQREGMTGLMRGLGKGMVGVVVKPTVGAIDVAEGLSTGIRNTTSLLKTTLHGGRSESIRLRPPRPPLNASDASATLHSYDLQLAFAYQQLHSSELFIHYRRCCEGHTLLISSERVLLLNQQERHQLGSEKLLMPSLIALHLRALRSVMVGARPATSLASSAEQSGLILQVCEKSSAEVTSVFWPAAQSDAESLAEIIASQIARLGS